MSRTEHASVILRDAHQFCHIPNMLRSSHVTT